MPELPEVETVRRGLEPHLSGARLSRVEQRRADLRFPFPEGFVQRLTGARVLGLERRAKYLLAPLSTDETLVAHLGMTGRFLVGGVKPGGFHLETGDDDKHTHVVLETEAGTRIAFNDARRFGYMDLIATKALAAHSWFAALGPEPLSEAFDAESLAHALAGRRQNIKASLLDQRLVAGLGNIYVCEALYRAGLNPERPAGSLTAKETARLTAEIKAVLQEAIEAGGSTLRDYRTADGDLGYFQHAFRAYDREGEPCLTRKCQGVMARIVQGGRSTFYCPVCQK